MSVEGGQGDWGGHARLASPCAEGIPICKLGKAGRAWERQGVRVIMPGWQATELCVHRRYSDLHDWERQGGQGGQSKVAKVAKVTGEGMP